MCVLVATRTTPAQKNDEFISQGVPILQSFINMIGFMKPTFLHCEAESYTKHSTHSYEPYSNIAFPQKITLDGIDFNLCAVGQRRVTILNIGVYAVGLYLQKGCKSLCGEELMNSNCEMLLRIVPLRKVDSTHLRNGFARFLSNDLKEESLPKSEEEREKRNIQELKCLIPKSDFHSNREICFHRTSQGFLSVYIDCKLQGKLPSTWIGSRFFSAYISKHKVISPELKLNLNEYFSK